MGYDQGFRAQLLCGTSKTHSSTLTIFVGYLSNTNLTVFPTWTSLHTVATETQFLWLNIRVLPPRDTSVVVGSLAAQVIDAEI
jgi:hypothetical protein